MRADSGVCAEFCNGDIVVLKNDNSDDSLLTIDVFQPSEFYWLIGGELVQANFIRLATTAERHANRRLTKDEQSLAEVS